MKHLSILAFLGLLLSSGSFATQAPENCDALAESNTRTNTKQNLGSTAATQQPASSTSTVRK